MTTFRTALLCLILTCVGWSAAYAADWSYTGEHGPDHWADLSGDYQTCAAGHFQSPFNIVPDIDADLANLDIRYNPMPVAVTNNGHTLVVNGGIDDVLRIGSTDFKLLQFHFHTPSEYMISGKSFPMELHFVHQAADGRFAVLGVMIAEGPANPALTQLWNVAPYDQGETGTADALFDPRDLLPSNQSYMRFMGSLTTPPCTEGINWHMLMSPITASADQIAAFQSVFPNNARPIQPRNGRLVVAEW
ncbi:carbonic anhydrase [Loktanella sp. R86503]|uniref:carbonic anhydrase n=1 Tax=Loktanella sp. R86503 TaxID=3093847 RepID=UPI0036DB531A